MSFRDRNPREREMHRPDRLLLARRKHEASRERHRELLPCICPDCGAVLGLAEPSEELLCRDCGAWAAADAGVGEESA